jgi:glycosyltransferase involved in cell wall biosynthesis
VPFYRSSDESPATAVGLPLIRPRPILSPVPNDPSPSTAPPPSLGLAYLSNGNLPSLWAHTFQTARMAEALAEVLDHFRLVIASGVFGGQRLQADLQRWYGLKRRLPLCRIRTTWRRPVMHLSPAPDPRFVRRAVGWARRNRFDAVWTRSHVIAEASLAAGLRVVFETHAGTQHPHRIRMRRIGCHPDLLALVTTLPALRAAFVEEGVPQDRILVLPNGVDVERYVAHALDRKRAREELSLPLDRPVAVYVGHLYQYKGIDQILDAARRLRDVHFIVVGGWPADVAAWDKDPGRPPNVELRGFVSNALVPRYLAAADVCLLPHAGSGHAARETCPLKLFEYMATRRPVVASGIPSLALFLQDGRNALVVPPEQEGALARGIQRVLDDPELAERLAEGGLATARQYTWRERARRAVGALGPRLAAARDAY